ncbi:glycosyltransferase family 61 protein [Halobiforma nitratireducens]|nr:glycosyltransferase family 61 protein [Halobiforma nitratireducens]
MRRTILDRASIVDQAQLRETAVREWECAPEESPVASSTEVPIPRKRRLPHSGSFEGLESDLPTSPFVTELEDVTVLGPSGLAITPDSGLVKDTVAPDSASSGRIEKILGRSLRQNGFRRTRDIVRSPTSYSNEQYSLATTLVPLWNNYYHWTLECLPKLLGIETYRRETGNTPTVLLPPNPSSWMLESLELVANAEIDTEPLRPGAIRVDRFVAPSYPTPSRRECFWVRDRVHDAVDVETSDSEAYPSRIYVSRRNATVRRVENEPAVLEALSEFDIEPFELETLSVSEQARLFANAEFVVSPHGAGLANIVYADDPTVLELFGQKEKTTFSRLSKLLNNEYHALFCDHTRKDIVVDTDELVSVITEILAGNREPVVPGNEQ